MFPPLSMEEESTATGRVAARRHEQILRLSRKLSSSDWAPVQESAEVLRSGSLSGKRLWFTTKAYPQGIREYRSGERRSIRSAQQDSRALRAPLRDELLRALLSHFHCAGVAFDRFAEGFRGGLIVTQFETPKRQPNITAIPTGHAGKCNESGVTCSGMTPFDLPAGAV
jgi:hypothetical protein